MMEDEHKHKCPKCDFVWTHSGDNAGDEIAHTCICGKVVWRRYRGDDPSGFVGCGKVKDERQAGKAEPSQKEKES